MIAVAERGHADPSAALSAWHVVRAQPAGRIDGPMCGTTDRGVENPRNVVATVDAGAVGCPAVSP